MKTFKVVALQILEGKKNRNIPLTDGLIINKENNEGNWIIEAYVKKHLFDYFQSLYEQNEQIEIRVIITHGANDPAPFIVKIHKIVTMNEHISVLFKGRLSKRRNEYLELLLEELIKEELSEEALIKEFRKRLTMSQDPVSND